MAKKKVIDADKFEQAIGDIVSTTYFSMPYTTPMSSGNASIDNAIQAMIRDNNTMLVNHFNSMMTGTLYRLKSAIMESARDEDGGLCGLCRINPDDIMPADIRPLIESANRES